MDLTSDISRGAWIRRRLEGWGVVGGVVPRGFDAYVRILHPFDATLFDLDESHSDEWGNPAVLEDAEWTWARVAERTGRTMHPLVQSRNLEDESHTRFSDGWRLGQTSEGTFDPASLARLVGAFRAATATPLDITVAVWIGWGFQNDGPGAAVAYIAFTADGDESADDERIRIDSFLQGQRVAVSGAVRSAVGAAPQGTLQLPGREYLLFETTLDELADPSWTQHAGIGGNGLPAGAGHTPQLLWPADHAWCLASEIDFDSTLVGGSRTLIDSILADDALETYEVGPDDDLTWLGDTINPAPPLP
ncbi:hypothetical protein [Diaminobutyricibacter sp. McL0608]|uniref:hypothetical protein n=1 Tax=Leifsonia sp. McL0608 TaxID=3143537 RepID=UPI0031F327C0